MCTRMALMAGVYLHEVYRARAVITFYCVVACSTKTSTWAEYSLICLVPYQICLSDLLQ